jgi:hypothetical protein
MKPIHYTLVILAIISGLVWVISKYPKAISNFQCTERILPKDIDSATCPPPSHLMFIGERWICSCRSEEQTMQGVHDDKRHD